MISTNNFCDNNIYSNGIWPNSIWSNSICPNWQEKIVYKIKNNTLVKRVEVIDLNTMKRYKKDSMQSLAIKAFLVFLFNPILLFLKIAFNFFQMGFDFAKVTIDSSLDMAFAIKDRKLLKIFEIYIISRIDFIKYIAEDVIAIVKAPFYALGIQIASLYTIFFPSSGRKFIGDIERSWNNNKSLKHDYRYNKETQNKPLYKVLWNIFLKRDESVVFYLAPCFQTLGSLKDKDIVSYSDI